MSDRRQSFAPAALLRLSWRYRKVLVAVTRVELEKRYSGSVLGMLWLLLHPLLLLAIYLFVYSVVFRMQLPQYKGFDYALFVFCGLIPFIGLSEALSAGTLCIKQNMHLVKNVMLPIELVPVRSVLASLATQMVSLALLLALLAASGHLAWKALLLPVLVALQVLMLVGIVLVLASLAVALTDVSYFVNLFLMLLMFVSPIGYTREMIPEPFMMLVDLNPVTYMVEAYRQVLLAGQSPSPIPMGGFVLIAFASYWAGTAFFERFKAVLADHE
ncbi:MAG: ABC transporter permease [Betaproteobacteria bacterium]|nr:ABC transporter permease [Betaproteobacteria bacterium]